jgi:hypothetical protein
LDETTQGEIEEVEGEDAGAEEDGKRECYGG